MKRKILHQVAEPGAARGYLVGRKVLQPHVARCDSHATDASDCRKQRVTEPTPRSRVMQRGDKKNQAYRNDGDALEDAQRTRFQV